MLLLKTGHSQNLAAKTPKPEAEVKLLLGGVNSTFQYLRECHAGDCELSDALRCIPPLYSNQQKLSLKC